MIFQFHDMQSTGLHFSNLELGAGSGTDWIKFLQLHHTSQNMCLDFQMCIPSQRQEAITSISSLSINTCICIMQFWGRNWNYWNSLTQQQQAHRLVWAQPLLLMPHTCNYTGTIINLLGKIRDLSIPTLHLPGLLQASEAAVSLVRMNRSRKSQQPQNSADRLKDEEVNWKPEEKRKRKHPIHIGYPWAGKFYQDLGLEVVSALFDNSSIISQIRNLTTFKYFSFRNAGEEFKATAATFINLTKAPERSCNMKFTVKTHKWKKNTISIRKLLGN